MCFNPDHLLIQARENIPCPECGDKSIIEAKPGEIAIADILRKIYKVDSA